MSLPRRLLNLLFAIALVAAPGAGLMACDYDEGPAEEFGETLDEGAEEMQEGAEEMQDEAEDLGDEY